jgi:hypothetical protein
MRPDLTAIYRSKICRLTYVICTVLVLFYFFFDGLDLDESNLLALEIPDESVVISAELTSNLELAGPSDLAEFWENTALYEEGSKECARLESEELPRSSPLDIARSHRYRVGLPRDSITDIFPFAVFVKKVQTTFYISTD